MAEEQRTCCTCGRLFLATNHGRIGRLPKHCEQCRIGSETECDCCGRSFIRRNAGQKSCGLSCAGKSRAHAEGRLGLRGICKHCGREFRRYRRDQKEAGVYCSRECSFVDRAAAPFCKVHFPECRCCGKVFAARHSKLGLCSDECRAEEARRYSRELAAARKDCAPRPCKWCGKTFAPVYGNKRRTFCSPECMEAHGTKQYRQRRGNNHRQRARAAGVEYQPMNKVVIYARDGWKCRLCGCDVIKWPGHHHPRVATLGHAVPLSRGGGHVYSNVQTACWSCNTAKGAMTTAEYKTSIETMA